MEPGLSSLPSCRNKKRQRLSDRLSGRQSTVARTMSQAKRRQGALLLTLQGRLIQQILAHASDVGRDGSSALERHFCQ